MAKKGWFLFKKMENIFVKITFNKIIRNNKAA